MQIHDQPPRKEQNTARRRPRLYIEREMLKMCTRPFNSRSYHSTLTGLRAETAQCLISIASHFRSEAVGRDEPYPAISEKNLTEANDNVMVVINSGTCPA